jgi:hypothetical protein
MLFPLIGNFGVTPVKNIVESYRAHHKVNSLGAQHSHLRAARSVRRLDLEVIVIPMWDSDGLLPVELHNAVQRALQVVILFEFGEAVDEATEVFDALDEIVEAYVLVGAVRVGA